MTGQHRQGRCHDSMCAAVEVVLSKPSRESWDLSFHALGWRPAATAENQLFEDVIFNTRLYKSGKTREVAQTSIENNNVRIGRFGRVIARQRHAG
jgi:hypothetical protein